jgi:glycosyltransferase involved in cell wall biosynthesis
VRIVLTIHHELDRNSGSPGTTIALAEAYTRAGHETEIVSFDDLPARLGPQARMVVFPLLVARRLAGALGRWCDVVDASSGDAWLWSLRRHRDGHPALVTRSHGLEHREHLERLADYRGGRVALRRRYFVYHGGARLREVAASLRRADLSFFLNREDLEFSVASLGVDRGRAHLVHNGIDDSLLGLPAPVAAPGEGVRIALIARHTEGMGAGYYVPALERILLGHPAVRVTLLGTGAPAARVLQDFAAAVRGRISVVPSFDRTELPRLLAGHELLASAKFSEGFGKALVEGMACGLAPVAAAASGPTTIIAHERTGLLVPPRDPDALFAGVERLLLDPALRLRLRAHAHAEAQRYSWDTTAAARLALMAEAVGSRSGVQAAQQPARRARRAASDRRPEALPDRTVTPDVEREQVA